MSSSFFNKYVTTTISDEEYEDIILKHLEELFATLPLFEGSELEMLEEGAYRIVKPLSILVLEQLHIFHNSLGEIGVYFIQGTWILLVSHEEKIVYPLWFTHVLQAKMCDLDFHSHPGEDTKALYPSWVDLCGLYTAKNEKVYIGNYQGLIELTKPIALPGGYIGPYDIVLAWNHWIRKELHLTEELFNIQPWYYCKEFFTTFFSMRLISWQERETIEAIFKKEEKL